MGAASQLGQGIKSMASASLQAKKEGIKGRVSQSAGGKLAAAIRANNSKDTPSDTPSSNSKASQSGGWAGKTGGLQGLSSADKSRAKKAHSEWQSSNPSRNTFDLNSYVSYVQEQKNKE